MFLSEIRWIAGLLLTPVLLFGTEFLRNGSLDKPDTEGRSPRSWIIPSEVKRDYREKPISIPTWFWNSAVPVRASC